MINLRRVFSAFAATAALVTQPANGIALPQAPARAQNEPIEIQMTAAKADCLQRQLPPDQELRVIEFASSEQFALLAEQGSGVLHIYQRRGADMLYMRQAENGAKTIETNVPAEDVLSSLPRQGGRGAGLAFQPLTPQTRQQVEAMSGCLLN